MDADVRVRAKRSMIMKIEYMLADPSGNKTILVLTPVPKEEHSTLAAALLARPDIDAEQVGYVTCVEGKPLRVDMMGGEFCGNASRAAAAYALSCDGKDQASTAYPVRAATKSCRSRSIIREARTMRPLSKCPILTTSAAF